MESTIQPLRGVDRWGLPAGLIVVGAAWAGGAVLIADGSRFAGLTIGAGIAEASLPIGVAITMLLDPVQHWLRRPPRYRDSFLAAQFRRRERVLFAIAVAISVVAVCGAAAVVVAELLDERVAGGQIRHLITLAGVSGLAWFALDINRTQRSRR